MLICGILDEMTPLTRLGNKETNTLLSYFFCQATDSRINSAAAVLRGLIYLLVDQQPLLISHVRKKYDHAGKTLFEDANSWVALSEIFTSMLQDPSVQSTYLILDALDECETGLSQLLDLVTRTALISTCVKWIVSSRNKPDIEARLRLDDIQMRLNLELNEEHVSRAVKKFIDIKVSKLLLIADDSALQETLRDQIHARASGTFLWVALVLKQLEHVESWNVLDVLQEMPPELEPLYDRMLQQIERLQHKDPEFCRLILSTMTLAYRPLHLLEIEVLSDLPNQISIKPDSVMKIINMCGSFLTIRENRVYFIHQSAKDFLLEKAFDRVFPSGKAKMNHTIFSRSVQVMARTLRRDIYELYAPGLPIEKVEPPVSDPLAAVQYSCIYWINHLLDCDKEDTNNDLKDGGSVHQFLRTSYIYWLEALSLVKSLLDGIVMIRKLESWLQVSYATPFQNITTDNLINIRRVVKIPIYICLYMMQGVLLYIIDQSWNNPLFNYTVQLLFSPQKRVLFDKHLKIVSQTGFS
jgi:hypothetical protein